MGLGSMFSGLADSIGLTGIVNGLIMGNQSERAASEAASKNREFQAYMSSTSHQREVEDLKAAGLNPVLSTMLGGSSVPSGSTASTPDYAGSVSAVAQARRNEAEARLMNQNKQESMSRTTLNAQNEKLSEEQTKEAASAARLKEIELERELAKFGQFDKNPDWSVLMPIINDMPPSMRGVFKYAISAMKGVQGYSKDLFDYADKKMQSMAPKANSAKKVESDASIIRRLREAFDEKKYPYTDKVIKKPRFKSKPLIKLPFIKY